jgi:hypothetical protein
MKSGPNYLTIHKVTSAGVMTATPLIIMNNTFTTGVKGVIHTGSFTVTLSQDKNNVNLAELFKDYLSIAATTTDEPYEDGVIGSSGTTPELVAIAYSGVEAPDDESSDRRQIHVFPCEITSASGDFTLENAKKIKRNFEVKAVKWNQTTPITISSGAWNDALVDDTDTTPAVVATAEPPVAFDPGLNKYRPALVRPMCGCWKGARF